MLYKDKKYYIEEINFFDELTRKQSLDLLTRVFKISTFTEDWWNWKYIKSPFGVAYGVCARDNETQNIVALRIVWLWKLSNGGKEIPAYQMVDTVTDPNYQRMGIFKNLTLAVLKHIDGNLIFNFPNHNSAPQNLKLGWIDNGNIPWLLCFSIPYISFNKNTSHGIFTEDFDQKVSYENYDMSCSKGFLTQWNNDLLKWRFAQNPLCTYYYYRYEETLIIYRIDSKKGLKMATVVFLSKLDKIILHAFSSFLFIKGILCFRYNAFNDYKYNFLENHTLNIKIKGQFRYFTRDLKNSIHLNIGDTDFL